VFTAEGVSPVFKSHNLAAARARHLSLPAPGSKGHMSLPGGEEGDRNPGDSGANAAVLLARGANGAIYRRDLAASRARSQQEGWSPMAPAVEGPVVAVATAADRVMLLALDGKGAALQAQAQAGHAAEKWTALGGTFTGRLTALGLAKSVELFAADAG